MNAITNAIDFDALTWAGTARKIQKDYLVPTVNNHLHVLRGVVVVVSARSGVFEISFTPAKGSLFGDEHLRIIRSFMIKHDFRHWLVRLLEQRHGWADLTVTACPEQRGTGSYDWIIQEAK